MGYLISLCSLLTCLSPGEQPDHGSAFLDALSHVPDGPFVFEPFAEVTFSDIGAALSLRGFDTPDSWEHMLSEADPEQLMSSLPQGLAPKFYEYLLISAQDYPEVLGFDFFDITSTVSFGHPPAQGIMLRGGFNPDAIGAAFGARGYEVVTTDEHGTILCPDIGCDMGGKSDMFNILVENVFGGDLGRRFPVWVGDSVIVGSPSYEVVEATAAPGGDQVWMADYAEVQAVASVLAAYPHTATVTLVNPIRSTLPALDSIFIREENPAEAAELLLAALNRQPLPAYSLVAYASVADEASEYGLVILVYGNEEQASAAATAVDARLDELRSITRDASYRELLEANASLSPATVIADEATDLHSVLLSLQAPIPVEPRPSGNPERTGLPYARLYDGYLQRDYLWLVPSGPAD